jgi:hypothetical protein
MRRTSDVVETRHDRAALVADAGFGKVSFISVLAGTLVAYGAFAVLAAIAAAITKALNITSNLSTNDWHRLGAVGGAVAAVVLLCSYYFGGYVAGRMARRAGVLNGLLVFVLGIIVAVGVAALARLFTTGDQALSNLRSIGVPTSGSEWRQIGTFAGLGSLAGMLLGSLLGGGAGERWHGKLLKRALDPTIGPEAEARAVADERHEAAVDRADRSTRATVVDDGTSIMSRSERDGDLTLDEERDRDRARYDAAVSDREPVGAHRYSTRDGMTVDEERQAERRSDLSF